MRKIISALLLFAFFSFPALAENVYYVRNVDVFVPVTDPTKARTQAITQGETKAFELMQANMIEKNIIRRITRVPPQNISAAVDSIDVVEEKFTGDGYRAQLNYTFNPKEVSRLIGIGVIATPKEIEKFLVIPVILEEGKAKLWKNLWWEAWSSHRRNAIILPVRDLEDIKDLREDDIAQNNIEGLRRMAARYKADNIVIVRAEYKPQVNALEVQLERIKGNQKTVVNYEYPSDGRVTGTGLYAAAASDLAYRLENNALTEESATAASEPEPQADAPQGNVIFDDGATGNDVPINTTPPQAAPGIIGAPQNRSGTTGPVQTPIYEFDKGPQAPLRPATPPASGQPAAPPTTAVQDATANMNRTEIVVTAPDLLTWNRIRGRLASTPGVRQMNILSLTAGATRVSVSHTNSIADLQRALEAQGFHVMNDGSSLSIAEKTY